MTTVAELTRIAEGREAEIFEWQDGRVLRLFRGQRSSESLDHEAEAMRAARAVVPLVPAVYEMVEIEGRSGIVMERVDGPDYITLLGSKPWQVYSAGTTLGKVQAQLHEVVAPDTLEPLRDRIRRVVTTNPLVPEDVRGIVLPVLDKLPDGDRLCHGDFHPGNLLKSSRGPIVIDWPIVTRGDPVADFARTEMLLRMGDTPPGTPALVKYLEGIGRKVINFSYRRASLHARPTDPDLVRRWQFVRAADRLGEDIESERETLLGILRS